MEKIFTEIGRYPFPQLNYDISLHATFLKIDTLNETHFFIKRIKSKFDIYIYMLLILEGDIYIMPRSAEMCFLFLIFKVPIAADKF